MKSKKQVVTKVEEGSSSKSLRKEFLNLIDGEQSDREFESSTCGGLASELPKAGPQITLKGSENAGRQLSLPLDKSSLKALLSVCKQPPTSSNNGKRVKIEGSSAGSTTLPLELPSSDFFTANPVWEESIQDLADRVGESLGTKGEPIKANIRKLQLYQQENNSFIQPCQDIEQETGVFASLIIQLPSECEGGHIVVSHKQNSKQYDFGASTGHAATRCHFAAHFCDTMCEMLPVTSGVRLLLVYNLCWTSQRPKVCKEVRSLSERAKQASLLIKDQWENIALSSNNPLMAVKLSHDYDADCDFSFASELEGNDREMLDVLRGANEEIEDEEKRLDLYCMTISKRSFYDGLGGGGDDSDPYSYDYEREKWQFRSEELEFGEEWFDGNGLLYNSPVTKLKLDTMTQILNYSEDDEEKFWSKHAYNEEYDGGIYDSVSKDVSYRCLVLVMLPKGSLFKTLLAVVGLDNVLEGALSKIETLVENFKASNPKPVTLKEHALLMRLSSLAEANQIMSEVKLLVKNLEEVKKEEEKEEEEDEDDYEEEDEEASELDSFDHEEETTTLSVANTSSDSDMGSDCDKGSNCGPSSDDSGSDSGSDCDKGSNCGPSSDDSGSDSGSDSNEEKAISVSSDISVVGLFMEGSKMSEDEENDKEDDKEEEDSDEDVEPIVHKVVSKKCVDATSPSSTDSAPAASTDYGKRLLILICFVGDLPLALDLLTHCPIEIMSTSDAIETLPQLLKAFPFWETLQAPFVDFSLKVSLFRQYTYGSLGCVYALALELYENYNSKEVIDAVCTEACKLIGDINFARHLAADDYVIIEKLLLIKDNIKVLPPNHTFITSFEKHASVKQCYGLACLNRPGFVRLFIDRLLLLDHVDFSIDRWDQVFDAVVLTEMTTSDSGSLAVKSMEAMLQHAPNGFENDKIPGSLYVLMKKFAFDGEQQTQSNSSKLLKDHFVSFLTKIRLIHLPWYHSMIWQLSRHSQTDELFNVCCERLVDETSKLGGKVIAHVDMVPMLLVFLHRIHSTYTYPKEEEERGGGGEASSSSILSLMEATAAPTSTTTSLSSPVPEVVENASSSTTPSSSIDDAVSAISKLKNFQVNDIGLNQFEEFVGHFMRKRVTSQLLFMIDKVIPQVTSKLPNLCTPLIRSMSIPFLNVLIEQHEEKVGGNAYLENCDFSWEMPNAKFPFSLEVENFLKSSNEMFKACIFNGISEARYFEYVVKQRKVYPGYSITVSPASGVGKKAHVIISKTDDDFKARKKEYTSLKNKLKRFKNRLIKDEKTLEKMLKKSAPKASRNSTKTHHSKPKSKEVKQLAPAAAEAMDIDEPPRPSLPSSSSSSSSSDANRSSTSINDGLTSHTEFRASTVVLDGVDANPEAVYHRADIMSTNKQEELVKDRPSKRKPSFDDEDPSVCPLKDDSEKLKVTKKRKKRDVHAPKPNKSAYMYYCEQERPELKKQFPELSFSDIGKKLAEAWKALDNESKVEFQQQAKADKERYNKEMEGYTPLVQESDIDDVSVSGGAEDDVSVSGGAEDDASVRGGAEVDAVDSVMKSKKSKKAKKTKDPNAPKRPTTSYFLWVAHVRESVKAEHPDASVSDLGKIFGAKWKLLSEEEKAPFNALASEAREKYKHDKEVYTLTLQGAKHGEAGGGGVSTLTAEPSSSSSLVGQGDSDGTALDSDSSDDGEDDMSLSIL